MINFASGNRYGFKALIVSLSIIIVHIAASGISSSNNGGGGGGGGGSGNSSSSSGIRGYLSKLLYDDAYITKYLDTRYPYLKRTSTTSNSSSEQSYIGIRDYFDFKLQFWPTSDYLEQINVEQYLFNELRAVEMVATRHHGSMDVWQYSNEQEMRLSGWPLANEQRCLRELAYLSEEIEMAHKNSSHLFAKGLKNIQLLRWIDSWGRPPSETYYGNTYWVGSYRGCKLAWVPFAGDSKQSRLSGAEANHQADQIGFRFCWAKLRAKDWPLKDEMRPQTSIRIGVCLPQSCDTLMAMKNKATLLSLMQFNFSPMHRQRFNRLLDDVYCLPDHRGRPLQLATKIFLAVSSAWLAIIIGSSGLLALSGNLVPISIRCLTIQENWTRFNDEDRPPPNSRIDLRVLGLIKLASALMVCVGHVFTEEYMAFRSSSILLNEDKKLIYHLCGFISKTLELFMVLTSLLASYMIISRFPRNRIRLLLRPHIYLGLNVARYLRLAPVVIFIIAFIKSTLVYLGDGPFWDYGTSQYSQQGVCHQLSWWRILLWPLVFDWSKSNGFSPYHVECLPPTWFIITEMKIFLIVPIYIYFIVTRKQFRLQITLAAVIISAIWQYKDLTYQQVIHMRQFLTYGRTLASMMLIKVTESGYFNPISRFHSTAIGLLAGLYLYEFKHKPAASWPGWMRSHWLLALIGTWHLYDLFGSMLTDYNYRMTGVLPNEELQKLFMILKPRLDSISFALLTLRLVSDWSQAIMRHSSLIIYKLSKLSYCVYCVHPILLTYFMSATEKCRPDTQALNAFPFGVFILVGSVAMALTLFILIESPLELLLNHLGDRERFVKKMNRLDSIATDALLSSGHVGSKLRPTDGKVVKKMQ